MSRGKMVYLMAVTRWLLDSRYAASTSILNAANNIHCKSQTGETRLGHLRDKFFMLHARQYAYSARAISITHVCIFVERRSSLPNYARISFCEPTLNIINAKMRRHVRRSLIEALPESGVILTTELSGATACISSVREFIVIATLASDFRWKLDLARCWPGDYLAPFQLVYHSLTQISLMHLTDLVSQTIRTRALVVCYNLISDLANLRGGVMSADLFNGMIILRAWPKLRGRPSHVWRVLVVADTRLDCGSTIYAMVMTSSRMPASPLVLSDVAVCCLEVSRRTLLLEAFDVATKLAIRRVMSHVKSLLRMSSAKWEDVALTQYGEDLTCCLVLLSSHDTFIAGCLGLHGDWGVCRSACDVFPACIKFEHQRASFIRTHDAQFLACGDAHSALEEGGVTPASNSAQQAQERRQIAVWADVSVLSA